MCGRFALTEKPEFVAEGFGLAGLDDFPPRYNIAPTQPILTVIAAGRSDPGSNLPQRQALLARWGLIPSWVKDLSQFPLLFNARSETAAEKASFRAAMRHRRILVPASGFYEWRRPPKESGLPAQAYWIRPRHGGVIGFGGLMETYATPDGSEIDTAAILTTPANAALRAIHERLPLVIAPQQFSRWLDCRDNEPRHLADLLAPAAEDFFEAIPVSDLVNKVANIGPELQKPVAVAETRAPPGPGQLPLF